MGTRSDTPTKFHLYDIQNDRIKMKRRFTIIVLLCGLFAQAAVAQKKKPGEPLETGFERKLGVVYKTVEKRKLQFDVYYPETGTEMPCPVIVYWDM
ncbi:MAG: hypothetical protein ACI9R3_001940 [Verrucomicrobiales bacterium]